MANVQGIKVTAYRLVDGSWKNVGNAITDENGDYDIGGLVDGSYVLKFEDVGVSGVRDAGTYQTVYTGGVYTLDAATAFTVSGSSTQDIQLSSATHIDGTVTV